MILARRVRHNRQYQARGTFQQQLQAEQQKVQEVEEQLQQLEQQLSRYAELDAQIGQQEAIIQQCGMQVLDLFEKYRYGETAP